MEVAREGGGIEGGGSDGEGEEGGGGGGKGGGGDVGGGCRGVSGVATPPAWRGGELGMLSRALVGCQHARREMRTVRARC